MFSSKIATPNRRLLICLACVYLSACSVNKPIVDESLEHAQNKQEQEQALLFEQEKQDQQAFQQALQLMQAADAKDADLQQAKSVFDHLYQANPDYLGALVNSADISYRLQDYTEAETAYARVVAQLENKLDAQLEDKWADNKNSATSAQADIFLVHSLNQLALMARERGQFEQAENRYRQALALDPTNPTVIRNLAILLDLYRGKLAEALVFYEQYQSLLDEPDAQVKDWIFDLKNRLPEENPHE